MNVKLFVSKASNSCFNCIDFFQMLLASQPLVKIPTKCILIERKNKYVGRLNFEILCSMYIMQELPTKSPIFFNNTQDFNQATHVGPWFFSTTTVQQFQNGSKLQFKGCAEHQKYVGILFQFWFLCYKLHAKLSYKV